MKTIPSKTIVEADTAGDVEFNLSIKCNQSGYRTLINLLGAIQYNCDVGHSAVVAAFFDGDGADKVKILGLPDNNGKEMAEACGTYGDDLMALIGIEHATAYNQMLATERGDELIARRKTVWSKPKSKQIEQ